MTVKTVITLSVIAITLASCAGKPDDTAPLSVVGTWQLIRATVVEKGDTTVTDYTKNRSFIKVINDTHFAFLQHDLTKGNDSIAVFAAGGGTYSLAGGLYVEQLTYCSDRIWEGNPFSFTVSLKHDTLTQRGVENVEQAGINRTNTETYIRMQP